MRLCERSSVREWVVGADIFEPLHSSTVFIVQNSWCHWKPHTCSKFQKWLPDARKLAMLAISVDSSIRVVLTLCLVARRVKSLPTVLRSRCCHHSWYYRQSGHCHKSYRLVTIIFLRFMCSFSLFSKNFLCLLSKWQCAWFGWHHNLPLILIHDLTHKNVLKCRNCGSWLIGLEMALKLW